MIIWSGYSTYQTFRFHRPYQIEIWRVQQPQLWKPLAQKKNLCMLAGTAGAAGFSVIRFKAPYIFFEIKFI